MLQHYIQSKIRIKGSSTSNSNFINCFKVRYFFIDDNNQTYQIL